MKPPELSELVQLTITAGAPIRANFRSKNYHYPKKDGTPVSSVDLVVHETLLEWTQDRPHMGYIGEEGDAFDGTSQYALYVDPLDGTNAYLRGLAVATVAVSVMEQCSDSHWEPILSVIHDPITEWTWAARKNRTGFIQQGSANMNIPFKATHYEPWRVTAVAWKGAPNRMEVVRRSLLQDETMNHQSIGATAIGAGLIASGLMNAVLFGGMSAVETAAMSLIVRTAGGVATDLTGSPLGRYELVHTEGKWDFRLPRGSIMSSCQELTEELIALIKRIS